MRPISRVVHEHIALGLVLALAAMILGKAAFLVGVAGPTHATPDGPSVSAEVRGDEVTIRWDRVTAPAGLPVVGYRVLVGETFALTLPATVTHVELPEEYTRSLAPGTHGFEVMAIEAGGNQQVMGGDFEVE
jgi:hypothetical protein